MAGAYTYDQLLGLCYVVGLRGNEMIIACAVCSAESGRRYWAHGHNPPTPGCSGGSIDRGLWQINDCYHPRVSDRCSYEPQCNASAMWDISSHGRNWHPWSSYNAGTYKRFLAEARRQYANGGWQGWVNRWSKQAPPPPFPPPPGDEELAPIDPTPKIKLAGRKLTAAWRPTSDALDAVEDLLRR